MTPRRLLPLLSLALLAACDDPDADARESLRDQRYCEILVGRLDAVSGAIQIDVYNTHGLNDCPADAWIAVDEAAVKAETMADVVILNGPRRWTIDSFDGSTLLDPAVHTLGGLKMRKAGALELSLADVMGGGAPYVTRTVRRDTTWTFHAGAEVYELVAPDGRVFDMQSYSLQSEDQTLGTLADLGARLALPTGWSFHARVLAGDLEVTAEGGLATIVQDELGNTYQRSQP